MKLTLLLTPLGSDTVTPMTPAGALAAIPMVAVICVGLTTLTFEIEIPGPALTVDPGEKLFPVSVIATLLPLYPEAGLIEVSVTALPDCRTVAN